MNSLTNNFSRFILGVALATLCAHAPAYPLDGEDESGIRRLEGYRLVQAAASGAKLSAGQLGSVEEVKLHLIDYTGPDFDQIESDPALTAALGDMLSKRDPSYSIVLLDFSDPGQLRWAGLRPDLKQNPGSVGKLMCMAALFNQLALAYPNPVERAELLKETMVKAGDWVSNEIHVVPKWDAVARVNRFSVINANDEFRLSEWIDHAISASANGAGTVLWREAMLLKQFGRDYPVDQQARDRFFNETPKSRLSEMAREVIAQPLIDAGIDTNSLQQGSFFTTRGKSKIPGRMSFATPRELTRLLFRIEQGRLVDAWSSLQMKKYMYLTKRRYRYSYAPELAQDAVYFKSGSLYSCRPEDDFVCGKYMGNKQNLMNSVAVVESSAVPAIRYSAVLMSDVRKVNSAWDHSRIAAAVHKTIVTGQATALRESASSKEMAEAGRSE